VTSGSEVVIAVAGVLGGALNTLVGGGSLVTFPVLLALGFPPVAANVTNSAGLLPGSGMGAWAYRASLPPRGFGGDLEVETLTGAALAGGAAGAVLLLALPAAAFGRAVPWLLGVACLLVACQPWLTKLRRGRNGPAWVAALLAGVYGGYFSAAQGVVFIAAFGAVTPWGMQQVNAVKNVCATAALCSAVALFAVAGHVAWQAAVLLAAGSVVGGPVGAWAGRRLPAPALRSVVVGTGIVAIARMVT
jgi:uncharacterized membrane protein YfcA